MHSVQNLDVILVRICDKLVRFEAVQEAIVPRLRRFLAVSLAV